MASRYAAILKQRLDFYVSFTHEVNSILKKLGLKWEAVLPSHISDGCMLIMRGMSPNIRNRDASFCGVQPLYRIGGTHVEGGK